MHMMSDVAAESSAVVTFLFAPLEWLSHVMYFCHTDDCVLEGTKTCNKIVFCCTTSWYLLHISSDILIHW